MNSATNFFRIKAYGTCPITTCSLHAQGCNEAVPSDSRVSMDPTTWAIQAVQNKKEGYPDENLCVRCSNGDQTIDQDFTVKQNSVCVNDAPVELRSADVQSKTFNFDADSTDKVLIQVGMKMLFLNEEEAICPLTECTLHSATSTQCSTEVYNAFGNIKLSSDAGSYKIKATNYVEVGYKEHFCVKCTNGFTSATKRFTYTQNA